MATPNQNDIKPKPGDVLLVTDVQNDSARRQPGGATRRRRSQSRALAGAVAAA